MVSNALASLDAWLELAEQVLAEQENQHQRPAARNGDGSEALDPAGADRA
jgi:hypothetical protein